MVMVQEWNFTWPLLSPEANKGETFIFNNFGLYPRPKDL
jgi:hypothetical protein